jgi:tetratricopeptide (TPR) repeat protein
LILFLFFFAAPLFAQSRAQPWWLSLEQGKQKFRSGDYGAALLSFEDARRQRRAMYEQMERDFINFLSVNTVRRIGDSLDRVERFSYDQHYTAASAALEELFYRIPRSTFNNSANEALAAFEKLKNYPEAEYWIGEIYRVEGELVLALAQYRRAYSMREVLEDQGFSVTIQYKISSMLRIRQEYNEMERSLLAIINDLDTLWSNSERGDISRQNIDQNTDPAARNPVPVPYAQASASFARSAMTRTLENEGIGRFMEFYRYNNNIVEQAHRHLGFYYAVSNRPSAQQHLMFAFLIQNTIIIDEIKRRRFDFIFTSLSALAEEINRNALLLAYVDEVEYYKTAYYLGASLYRNGKTSVARNFWEFLASQPQAGEWYSRASLQLRNPHLEPVVEMP